VTVREAPMMFFRSTGGTAGVGGPTGSQGAQRWRQESAD